MLYATPLPIAIETIAALLTRRQHPALASYLLENYSPSYAMEMNEFQAEAHKSFGDAARYRVEAQRLAAIVWLDQELSC